MTSVKEFRVERVATADRLGRGRFVFTDDYSMLDWGKMPDSVPEKGASLCTMGAANFELLEANDIDTHYRGVHAGEDIVSFENVDEPQREMAIDLTRVPELPNRGRNYDYDAFHATARENYLIPLEIVFRNTVPIGSSLRSRTDPSDVGLAYDEWPDEPIDLPESVVEFSTKFEEADRYLSRGEADHIAGQASIDDLESLARDVNDIITRNAANAQLRHEDGKIECLYYDGDIRVADVVGTFDEDRFSHDDQVVSKEVLRQYHRSTQPDWVDAVARAKQEAKERDVANWQTLCDAEPQPLQQHVIDAVSNLYTAGTNAYIGRKLFDAPPLPEAIETVKEMETD